MPFDELNSNIEQHTIKPPAGMFLVFVLSDGRRLVLECQGTELFHDILDILANSHGIARNSVLLFCKRPISEDESIDMIHGLANMSEIVVNENADQSGELGGRMGRAVLERDYVVGVQELVKAGYDEAKAKQVLVQVDANLALAKALLENSVDLNLDAKQEYAKLGVAGKAAIKRMMKMKKNWNVVVCTYVSFHKDEVKTKRVLSVGL